MLDWYTSHTADIENAFQWILYFNGFLLMSALMYIIYDVGLWEIGLRRHAAIVRKDAEVGQFPPGYFTMLAIQLLPLAITGLVLHDPYIIGTRFGTLIIVLIVYGMIATADGTFNTKWYRFWMMSWLCVAILGPMVWVDS